MTQQLQTLSSIRASRQGRQARRRLRTDYPLRDAYPGLIKAYAELRHLS